MRQNIDEADGHVHVEFIHHLAVRSPRQISEKQPVSGAFLAAAVWGGQWGGHIFIWGGGKNFG